jgi:hypothetical protein
VDGACWAATCCHSSQCSTAQCSLFTPATKRGMRCESRVPTSVMESWQGISDRALGTSCLIAMTAMTAFGAWRAVFGRASMIPGAMRPQHNENTCEFPNCDNNNAERRDGDNDFKATSRRRRRLRPRMPRAAGLGACDGAEKFGKARASAKKRSTPPGQHSPHRPCTTKPLPAPLHVNPQPSALSSPPTTKGTPAPSTTSSSHSYRDLH